MTHFTFRTYFIAWQLGDIVTYVVAGHVLAMLQGDLNG